MVATAALLERVPNPSEDVIREELSGNLCRCTGYAKIFDAVRAAAASTEAEIEAEPAAEAGEGGASY